MPEPLRTIRPSSWVYSSCAHTTCNGTPRVIAETVGGLPIPVINCNAPEAIAPNDAGPESKYFTCTLACIYLLKSDCATAITSGSAPLSIYPMVTSGLLDD